MHKKVIVGDSEKLTEKKLSDWNGYQKCEGKIHHVTLYDTAVIPGLNINLFSVTRAPQKGFQVTSEDEALILQKKLNRNTRFQTTPLFWAMRIGKQKGRQPRSWKGQRSRNENKRQSKNQLCVKFMSTNSTRSLAIQEKIGCAQLQRNYTKALRGP